MLATVRGLHAHRELLVLLAWKTLATRYRNSYFGILWALVKPVVLVLIFMLVRSFVGIETGALPYPLLTFAALVMWIFFQESASDGVHSIVGHAALIRKAWFPREILPLTAVLTKLVEWGLNALVLAALMAWYGISPTVHLVWVPLILAYAALASLAIALVGSAVQVWYRDLGQMLPVLLSLLMYASPVLYPLQLVRDALLVRHVAGEASPWLYQLYLLNPLAGTVDAFQGAVVRGVAPDPAAMLPGALLVAVALPLSLAIFRRAERHFADVV
jgi:lipopolysaccharide transport system permease protein